MGSHCVTCHPTQVKAPLLTPARKAGTRFNYPGGKEGLVDLVAGYILAHRQSPIPVLTGPGIQ